MKNAPVTSTSRFYFPARPLPAFSFLMLWSKFRLLQGLKTGQPLEAARDVRHLAWLAYRTDTLLGGTVAAWFGEGRRFRRRPA